MAKYAIIKLLNTDIYSDVLDKQFMQDLFDDLPDDSVVVSLSNELTATVITIYSNDFINTTGFTHYPEITYTIQQPGTNSCGGKVTLDLSKALAKKQTGQNQSCSCGSCYNCLLNGQMKAVLGGFGIPPGHLSYTSPSIPQYAIPDPSKYRQVNTTITFGCSHDWKVYDSGWTREEYCIKCPEKRKA